eukprot:g47.t1
MRAALALLLAGAAVCLAAADDTAVLEFKDADGSCTFRKNASKVVSDCAIVADSSSVTELAAQIDQIQRYLKHKDSSYDTTTNYSAICDWVEAFSNTDNVNQLMPDYIVDAKISHLKLEMANGETREVRIHPSYNTLRDAFNAKWEKTRFLSEPDESKMLGAPTGNDATQLWLLNDHDIGKGSAPDTCTASCSGWQKSYWGTPNGLISFGHNKGSYCDRNQAGCYGDQGTCCVEGYYSTVPKKMWIKPLNPAVCSFKPPAECKWQLAFDNRDGVVNQVMSSTKRNLNIDLMKFAMDDGSERMVRLNPAFRTLNDAYAASWKHNGFLSEPDQHKKLGIATGNDRSQLWLLNDHDIGPGGASCGASCSGWQKSYAGTPDGLISFGHDQGHYCSKGQAGCYGDQGTCCVSGYYGTVPAAMWIRPASCS